MAIDESYAGLLHIAQEYLSRQSSQNRPALEAAREFHGFWIQNFVRLFGLRAWEEALHYGGVSPHRANFNRSDVQAAINTPPTNWGVCSLGVFDNNLDSSAPPNIEVLFRVIERLKKTLIVSGQLDLILPTNGTL
ncbi:hypothetical protein R3P38DRAFT_3235032 [Favolaschia claudopus]|uniref:Uncharacterized protein n=1 Tax=Favolaschia claudopus TaxID=2862362 RepID=A0AAV9ZGP8_9AGAR